MPTLSLTDPSNGTTADATLIANNNSAIKTLVNGGLQNDNISDSAALAAAKIAGYPSDASKYLLGDGSWGSVSMTIALDKITTSGSAISATTEATAVSVVAGSTASYTAGRVWAQFFIPGHTPSSASMVTNFVLLYDTTAVATISYRSENASGSRCSEIHWEYPVTVTAGVHSFTVAAYSLSGGGTTFTPLADAGGTGKLGNGYLRIKRD